MPPIWEHPSSSLPANTTIPTSGEMRKSQSGNCITDSPSNISDCELETEVEPSGEEPVLVTASVKMMCQNDEHKTHTIFCRMLYDVMKMKLVSSLKQEILY